MASRELLDYVRNARAQGITDTQIRFALRNAGYPLQDIEDALAPRAIVPARTLAFVLSGIGALAIIVITVLVLLPGPKTFSLLLTLQQQDVPPGQSVLATATLTSEQSKTVPVRVTFELIHAETNRVVATRLTRQEAGKSLAIAESIPVPPNAPPGAYVVRTIARYDSSEARSEQSLTITTPPAPMLPSAEAPEEFLAPAPAECPATCDDFNPCTRDYCAQGTCRHDVLSPCCGNAQCEPGENSQTCPEDCAQRAVQLSTALAQAQRVVLTNPEQAALLCTSIGNTRDSDQCFADIAKTGKNPALCNPIQDDGARDGCYLDFAFEQNEFSVCPSIRNRYLLTSCLSYANAQGITVPTEGEIAALAAEAELPEEP